jgi:hypothetical protein
MRNLIIGAVLALAALATAACIFVELRGYAEVMSQGERALQEGVTAVERQGVDEYVRERRPSHEKAKLNVPARRPD